MKVFIVLAAVVAAASAGALLSSGSSVSHRSEDVSDDFQSQMSSVSLDGDLIGFFS